MFRKVVSFFKKNILGIIIGGVIFGSVGVLAAAVFPSNSVTYDNKTSGLESTNVQGAIDELYNACKTPATGGNGILEKVPIVTEGDGLYKDEYEDGRYFYKGGNPNNYVTFNNEQAGWRIVSIESDGTIKIMRMANIGDQYWDTSGISNNWARPASLNTYLNGTYYSSLNATVQNEIVAKDWSIGAVIRNNNDLATQINDENETKWYGKVALITLSEYLRSNSNKSSCESLSLNNNNYSSCKNTTWMFNNTNWWTLSPHLGNSGTALYVRSDGLVDYEYISRDNYAVRPVVYLSSEVKITGGDGSKNKPYQISL